ncbi:MAG: helix-turn-helix transcriptional regulator [Planctomycetes bacterium]|nr:helix-turn-helix transcriptional regulator [Planctomycetota bacterium]
MTDTFGWLDAHCRNDSAYRTLDFSAGIRSLGCGFVSKSGSRDDSQCPDHYSAVYVLRGQGLYETDTGERYALVPGSAFQRFTGMPHRLLIDPESGWAECWIALAGEIQAVLPPFQMGLPDQPVLNPGLQSSLVRDFESILQQLKSTAGMMQGRILASVILLLTRLHEEDQRASPPAARAEVLNEARRLPATDLASRAPVAELIASLNLGYENFRKLFTRQMGVSPAIYRIRARIDEACRLLTRQSFSIKEVAALLGYPNAYAFSAQFRQVMGIPPGRFRDTH